MAEFDFDHAVVGGGIVGSWTALHLVRKGKKVLLLEQFSQPHTRGSSHGSSRIIRSSYAEPEYCGMMPHACRMWAEAELETGQKLIERTGLLCIANTEKSAEDFEQVVANMKIFCPESIDTADPRIGELLSTLLHYPDAKGALWDKSGGIILAHKAVLTIQALYRERGGEHWENCPVKQIEHVNDQKVRLHLNCKNCSKVVTVRSVVVTAGTWTKKLLSPFVDLPLQAAKVIVYYWKPKKEGAYSEKSGFPTVIDINAPQVYALPSYEYPGLVKVCAHNKGAACDPDERDKTPPDAATDVMLRQYVQEHYPLLDNDPVIMETCMYTLTPDEAYLIDLVPNHKNIVIGSACSGMGFKTSPVVGRLLSDLATGTKPLVDVSPFSLSRFSSGN